MATITWAVLKHHKKADGTYNPKVRVTHNRSVSYMSTDIYTQFVKFKRGSSMGVITDGDIMDCLNDIVRSIRQIVNTNPVAVEQMETAKELAGFIERYKKRQNLDIDYIVFATSFLETLPKRGTESSYKTAINVLRYYMREISGEEKLPIKSFTAKFLMRFESWLRTERIVAIRGKKRSLPPMSDNGISHYMDHLKHVFNRLKAAYNDYELGDILIKAEPFKVYSAPKLRPTKKRAISREEILRIYNYVPKKSNTVVALARDLFIFSFMAAGMNAVDMYNCPAPSFGRIEYYRSKTADRKTTGDAFMSISITGYLRSVIDKYGDLTGKRLFRFADKYVNHYRLNVALCRGLKVIGEDTGIGNLQFYCARHSFATIARNDCGVGMDDIALCLTHASFYRVTDTYVKPDFSRVDRVIEKVVDYVFHEKEIGR